ncbi:MAG: hypothetical protein JXC36_07155 [Candidatus Atribacteria bacterium]|nr:hypothetical protein [Candidatus Atribacteria bacterium]
MRHLKKTTIIEIMINNKNINFIWLNFIFILGCTSALMDKPQPLDSKNLNSFPKKIRRVLIDDKETIIFKRKVIEIHNVNAHVIPLNEIDSSNYIFKDDYLLNKRDNKGPLKFQIKEDTVYFTENDLRKVYLSDSLILKNYKNYYFLNYKENNMSGWDIYLIEDKKNEIIYRYLKDEDLNILQDFNAKPIDTIQGIIIFDANILKKDMIKFIEKGGFSDTISIISIQHDKIVN